MTVDQTLRKKKYSDILVVFFFFLELKNKLKSIELSKNRILAVVNLSDTKFMYETVGARTLKYTIFHICNSHLFDST